MSEPTLPFEGFGRQEVPGLLRRSRTVLLPDTPENHDRLANKLTKVFGGLLVLHWVLAFMSFGATFLGMFFDANAAFYLLIPFFALFPHQFLFIIGGNMGLVKKILRARWDLVQGMLRPLGLALTEDREEDVAVDLAVPLSVKVSRDAQGVPVLKVEPQSYGLTPEAEEIDLSTFAFTPSKEIPRALSIPLTRDQCVLDLSVDPDDETSVSLELRDKGDRDRFCVKVHPETLYLSKEQVRSLPRLVSAGVTLPPAEEELFLSAVLYLVDVQGVLVPDVMRQGVSAPVAAS